jgi:hypothetical protein
MEHPVGTGPNTHVDLGITHLTELVCGEPGW